MTASFITVDQLEEGHALVLGTTGSGKTYQVRGMLEQLRRADRRVGAIDKLGNHWGLTLDRDGKSAGLDFVIFGGKRAQVPMEPGQGAEIGRLFVERHIPAIFDISQWDADEQAEWLAAFATAVFRLNDGALHLSIDEAQSFAPTNGGGKDAKGDAFRAVRLLAEQGRGNGVRLLLACQRLSRLDTTVREMMHTVVVMRQVGTTDRKAVKDLISIDAEQATLIERDLPKLDVGTGFVWQAGGADLRRIKFGENATFDSSRTPRHGDKPPAPIATSSALVDELRAALAPAVETRVAPDMDRDPLAVSVAIEQLAERNGRIAELETELAHAKRLGDILYSRGIVVGIGRARDAIGALVDAENDAMSAPPLGADTVAALQDAVARDGSAAAAQTPRGATTEIGGPPPAAAGDAAVRGRKALLALAGIHPATASEAQWATLAGYAKTGGTWGTHRSALRAAGLVQDEGGRWSATGAGVAAAGGDVAQLPPPGADRARFWAPRVNAGRLVEVLIKRWPHWTTRDALAADAAYAAGGGTFGAYVGRLRANGLIEEQGKRLRLSAEVMGETV